MSTFTNEVNYIASDPEYWYDRCINSKEDWSDKELFKFAVKDNDLLLENVETA